MMASVYIKNCCYNKNTRKTPHESFTSSKPNLDKMHIFGMTCFGNIQNKMKLNPCEKGIIVSYDKQSPASFIFQKQWLLKECNIHDAYDNSSQLKPDKNTKFPEYLITYDVQPKDNLNTERERQINRNSIWQRKKSDFFVVKNFEFGGVDYHRTLHTIPIIILRHLILLTRITGFWQ